MARLGMLIDLRTCIGCHACSVACKSEFDVPLGVFRDTVKYAETGHYPSAKRHFIPVLCNHCEDAPCLKACPTEAITRLKDGQVVINEGDCNVNRYCMAACPYEAIYVDPEKNVAQKCTFCDHRTSQGLKPACVEACPTHCRIFGDLDDPQSEIAAKAKREPVTTWKSDAGTLPKVLYVDPHGALRLVAESGVQVDKRPQVPAPRT
jgi:tetrathionate reductase subunit B